MQSKKNMAYLRQCLLELRAIERHATTIDFVDAPETGAAAALRALRTSPMTAATEPGSHTLGSLSAVLAGPSKA